MERDEISLLEEELIQLSVKSLLMERSKIRLVASPFWVKVGHFPLECDQKDLMLAIVSTFGGVFRSKVKGCGRMDHSIKECSEVTTEIKNLPEDELPYSLALKAEINLLGKESLKLGSVARKSMKQWSYTGVGVEVENVTE
ncbi:hypothetical protein Goshw_005934 [Gossypium schwendimanii]|uniref:DUF4283 domain-containing protein n=1 Tax=Gossypium schwendimanii TaxID=34291 RepID=A0A7J9MG83_GOSSC|nr:hypothetical protein [Gossypium schwendimanii]